MDVLSEERAFGNSPVIVCGTGRSGTSVVAKICHELGVDMGGPGDTSRESNPGGDYERPAVNEINQQFSDSEVNAFTHRDVLLSIAEAQTGPWGFKHPGSAPYQYQVLAVFPAATLIWCKRDSEAVARSFSKWYDRDIESCRNTVKRRERGLHAALVDRKNVLTIDMTNRWDEAALTEIVESFLRDRGAL